MVDVAVLIHRPPQVVTLPAIVTNTSSINNVSPSIE